MAERSGRVTIYAVAERAGVSISTVSLTMNAPDRVSGTTREKVLTAAGELGYRPDGARPVRVGAPTRIGVAAPFSSYPTYFRRLAGMLEHSRHARTQLVTLDLGSAADSRAPALDALPVRGDVDALIVMGVPVGARALDTSSRLGVPIVLVDAMPAAHEDPQPPTVLVDDELGGRMVAQHLRSRGHRHALFLHDPQRSASYVSAGMLRGAALAESLELATMAAGPDGSVTGVVARVTRDPSLTAVVGSRDALAVRARHELLEAGLRVPGDVAVVGYDDGELAEATGLTTVRQPFERTGSEALDLALKMVADPSTSVSRIDLAPDLVVRSSS